MGNESQQPLPDFIRIKIHIVSLLKKEAQRPMSTMKPRVTSFAPQFLVDDLERSIAYYQKIGFTFGEPWEGSTRSVFWTDWNFT